MLALEGPGDEVVPKEHDVAKGGPLGLCSLGSLPSQHRRSRRSTQGWGVEGEVQRYRKICLTTMRCSS
jgi:hypothetical protein